MAPKQKTTPKKTIVKKNITINHNHNTINNYYAPAPAPATAVATAVAAPEAPPPLFAGAERAHKVHRPSDKKKIYVSYACADGTLKAGCYNCSNHYLDIARFAPDEGSMNTAGNRQVFDAAYKAYQAAHAKGDKDEAIAQREIVEAERAVQCDSCRERHHLSRKPRGLGRWEVA